MFQNVIVAWLFRRALEVGGVVVFVSQVYAALPPYVQAAIAEVLTGAASPQNIAIAIGGIVVALWGYVWSFRSTVGTHVVTGDKQQIPVKPDTRAASEIEAKAVAAPKPKTILERIAERFGR